MRTRSKLVSAFKVGVQTLGPHTTNQPPEQLALLQTLFHEVSEFSVNLKKE